MLDITDPELLFSPEWAVTVLAMSELLDRRCPKCSSELIKLDDGTYYCKVCKVKYKAG